MAEHHRGNVLVVELAIAWPPNSRSDRRRPAAMATGVRPACWRDIADRIQILDTGALKCIDQDVAAGVELDLQRLQP